MRDRLLCFCDESLFAGDKNMQAKVKGMQTENTFIIEPKGIDAEIVNNHRRFIYASNSEWVVAKEGGDRRFVVIDVPNKKMSREKYNAMAAEWANGGKEGFYYYLTSPEMQESIKHFDFEAEMVQTKGGLEQIMQTEPLIGWWHEILVEGGHMHKSLDTGAWSVSKWNINDVNLHTHLTESIYQSFQHYMETSGGKTYSGRKQHLGRQLQNLQEKGIIHFDNTKRDWDSGKMIWEFESIQDARKRWDAKWNNNEDTFGIHIKTTMDDTGNVIKGVREIDV